MVIFVLFTRATNGLVLTSGMCSISNLPNEQGNCVRVPVDQEMAARLRRARGEAGYESASAAVRALGLKKETYFQYENGIRGFRKHLPEFARVFGVTEKWLRSGQGSPSGDLGDALQRLWQTIESRRSADPASSYTAKLLARGNAKVAQKFGEEAVEAVIEGVRGDRAALVGESADVLYHLLVMWAATGVSPEEVAAELARREGASGLSEKEARKQRGS